VECSTTRYELFVETASPPDEQPVRTTMNTMLKDEARIRVMVCR
jgi:hypothetical protein